MTEPSAIDDFGVSDGLASPCQRCRHVPVFDWHVDDATWAAVCPPDWRLGVLCLRCFVHYCENDGVKIEDRLAFVDLATPTVSIRFGWGEAEAHRWTADYGGVEHEGEHCTPYTGGW